MILACMRAPEVCTPLTDNSTNTLHLARLQVGGIGMVLMGNASRDGAGCISTERVGAGHELEGGFNLGRAAVEDWREDIVETFFSDFP